MASKNKILVLLGDGMGGRPVPELDGRTAIEAAATPALDRVARDGACGMLSPISRGVPAGSDTSHMALLGYNPYELYRGRGPFEAKGVGLDINPGDVAFRCNFSTVDPADGRAVLDRRAGRIHSGTDQLRQAINEQIPEIDGVQILFKESVEHRCALVLRGEGINEFVTEVDPHSDPAPGQPAEQYHDCKPLPGHEDDPEALFTAQVVNKFVQRCFEVLNDHEVNRQRVAEGKPPANIALPRGVGTAVHLEPFATRYGLNGAIVVEVDLVRGLAMYLGMEVINAPGATGGRDTDEISIAQTVVSALADHDFILANIKAPDLGGHDRDPEQKIVAVQKVDRAVAYLLDNLDFGSTVMMLAADHCTPISVGDHSGDPIPTVFFGHGVTPDCVQSYGERACAQGCMGHFLGADVMNILTNYSGSGEKFGA
jgi:2,3-bisphosphoglycerate-independent phosphoglycerate mutase